MSKNRVQAAVVSHMGNVRRNNEDNFYFDGRCLEEGNDGLEQVTVMSKRLKNGARLAVFDGMGGENFGEVASFAAAECMKRIRPGLRDLFKPERFLNSMCLTINQTVIEKQEELLTRRMGSTLVSLFFSCGFVYICNLGDSRAYRLRDSELTQLSEDHVERRGGLNSRKAPLTQHLGIRPDDFIIEPYITKDRLKRGDQYLLCSDGLTDMLSDEEIQEIMSEAASAEACARKLVDAALERGGKDNTTVIVCRIR